MSQIARTIAKVLRLHEELTEAIALGHDLGHTPFGHAGERVIDTLMPGGFNHYEQSLRIVDAARERRPRAEPDLGGARRHREALEGEVGRAGRHAAGAARRAPIEGQIMRVADLIAYVNHDIDDAMRAGLLRAEDLPRDLGRGRSATRRRRASGRWSRTWSPRRWRAV